MEGSVIVPTWDLFIIIFGCLVVAYNFIIGREVTIRLIISTYIAILAGDGLVSTVHKYVLSENSLIENTPTFAADSQEIIIAKIVTFLLLLVLLSVKGGFRAHDHSKGSLVNFFYLILFGVFSAALILVSILAFLSGGSFIDIFSNLEANPTSLSNTIYQQSQIAKYLVEYSALVFALPALTLIASTLGFGEED